MVGSCFLVFGPLSLVGSWFLVLGWLSVLCSCFLVLGWFLLLGLWPFVLGLFLVLGSWLVIGSWFWFFNWFVVLGLFLVLAWLLVLGRLLILVSWIYFKRDMLPTRSIQRGGRAVNRVSDRAPRRKGAPYQTNRFSLKLQKTVSPPKPGFPDPGQILSNSL